MSYSLTEEQLNKERKNLEKRERILMYARCQNFSAARLSRIQERMDQNDARLDENREQFELLAILTPVYEQGKQETLEHDAEQRGDMGEISRQKPNENAELIKEATGRLVKELKMDPQMAAHIVHLLQSGDDEKIKKGIEKGDKIPGKADEKTAKKIKQFKKKLNKFIKLHKQMVAALKKLHHSDSNEVKSSMHAIKHGRMTAGLRGLKGVARQGGFENDTAKAAQSLMGAREGMEKLIGFNTDMILKREFKRTANQPNFNAAFDKTKSDKEMDIATEHRESNDRIQAENDLGTAPKKKVVPVDALKAATSASR